MLRKQARALWEKEKKKKGETKRERKKGTKKSHQTKYSGIPSFKSSTDLGEFNFQTQLEGNCY